MSESKKTYVNVGMVGSVSNGKTTLVKCLTGVNTKRNSSEIKSGRTIKLGYANCIVWKCSICGAIKTSGQDQKSMECCSFDLEPDQYISFIDAPGHHSFVHTMIKGTAIIDCAIIVTDARTLELQQQTLEHLVILETLDVRNVLVVQNKIDLVDKEQLKKNYEMLQQELKGTVAEGAPIIPISAQSNIGIEYVQAYLHKMCERALKNMRDFKQNVFTVIRSFDINHPDTGVDGLRGGVLGGTVTGQCGYKIGDEIEIRPGYIKGDVARPLSTTIVTIFSESKSCKDMARGGLYGVGTKLDPMLTKADGLVGCLFGKSEELPPIISTLDIQVHRMRKCIDGTDMPKIQLGAIYQLIIGSMVVKAAPTKKIESNTYTFKLQKPICTANKKCIIYTADAKLMGCGWFGQQDEAKTNNSVGQTEKEYLEMFPGTERKEREKLSVPVPILEKESKNVVWANITAFCRVIKREESQVSTYICKELCIQSSSCQTGLRMTWPCKNPAAKLQSVLRKYIAENVCCGQCKGLDTVTQKNAVRGFEIHCLTCGSDCPIV